MSSKKSLTTVLVMVLIIVMTLSGCDDLFGASDDDNGGNSAPVANAGPDQEVEQGVSVTLDGTESTDADGDALTYEWAFTVVPDESALEIADITDADTSIATFRPDVPGTYTVRLTVSDGAGSDTDLVDITVAEVDMSQYMGADDSGNLVILNDSGSVLMLYRGSTPLRYIPDDASDFLLNLSTGSSDTLDLRVYKYPDVEDDLENPDSENIFKRWNVALADSTALADRSTWYVGSDDSETTAGTLEFSYLAGSSGDTSADVYLNSRTGAKILSLSPGVTGRTVGVDYGNYTVLYRYWRSDPSSASGAEEVGWIEEEQVGDETAPIYAILNSSRELRRFDVPGWNNNGIAENTYATVTIYNDMAIPYKIWIGGNLLIEDVMYTDEPVENRSTIAAGDSAEYTLEEGTYNLVFKDLTGSETLAEETVELEASATGEIRVNARNDVSVDIPDVPEED
jgi:PKD repeat protein